MFFIFPICFFKISHHHQWTKMFINEYMFSWMKIFLLSFTHYIFFFSFFTTSQSWGPHHVYIIRLQKWDTEISFFFLKEREYIKVFVFFQYHVRLMIWKNFKNQILWSNSIIESKFNDGELICNLLFVIILVRPAETLNSALMDVKS